MKTKLMLLAILLLAGCTNVPANFGKARNDAARKYASVMNETTKDALVASLGTPEKEEALRANWEDRYDSKNYESLSVDFAADGRVIEMTKAHGRRSWNSFGSFERAYEYHKPSKAAPQI